MVDAFEGAQQSLVRRIATLQQGGASAEALVDLVVRSGWQPRVEPATGSDYVEGVLDSGKRVRIEIRRGRLGRVA